MKIKIALFKKNNKVAPSPRPYCALPPPPSPPCWTHGKQSVSGSVLCGRVGLGLNRKNEWGILSGNREG